ncbi:hypothetical protein [Leptospira stimsonii]|uniref:Uncharacterized protein n=1 Tax=Leptospira stimsonii TaxID=2202203 RepID=A0A396YMC1_9LEPT|nr:hypothetical protein [Leptospira stimsonii]RHX83935.1 hypothetical protein DLM75_23255 [Leptospira stimsonii]
MNLFKSLFSTSGVELQAQERLNKNGINTSRIENDHGPLKDIGIFKDYPKDPSRWRVGKLFKHSLGLKFSRAK